MNKTHLYYLAAAVAIGYVLADTLVPYRPFTDAFAKGASLATKAA